MSATAVTIIANPAAGKGLRLAHAVRDRLLTQGASIRFEQTTAPAHASVLAADAVERGDRLIVASGGDGTINEVVNGMRTGSEDSRSTLAIVPAGSVNILAAVLGLPRGTRRLTDYVLRGVSRPVRLGIANGRLFTGMVSVGFDAACVHHVDLALKKRIGPAAYGWAALKLALRYKAPQLHVLIDGQSHQAAAAIVLRGPYYAGRFTVAPEARLDTDLLWVCLVTDSSRWALARFAALLPLGLVARMGGVKLVAGCQVSITSDQPVPAEVDGDAFGATPVHIGLAEHPIRLQSLT